MKINSLVMVIDHAGLLDFGDLLAIVVPRVAALFRDDVGVIMGRSRLTI